MIDVMIDKLDTALFEGDSSDPIGTILAVEACSSHRWDSPEWWRFFIAWEAREPELLVRTYVDLRKRLASESIQKVRRLLYGPPMLEDKR